MNQSKSAEIVFTDSWKRHLAQPPPPLQGIARVTSLKVLGVTVTEKLSVTEHVDDVINSCARSMYAISVLRSHGMCVPLLQQVFQSVVTSKLTYAAPAWWGFLTSADRQCIETFLRRAARSGLWESAMTAEELVNDADERLFWKVRHCDCLLYTSPSPRD